MSETPASGGAATPPGARYCPSCGAASDSGGSFCPACGAAMSGGAAVAATTVNPGVTRPCPSCGREWGQGIACQFCDQVEGFPPGVKLSSSAKRFGAHVLDSVLMVVTLFIGWLVWQLIVASKGQSPAKQLLGMRVVKLRTGTKATWGTMFLREVILKPLIGLGLGWFFGLVYFWLLWDKNRQELWDKMIATVVVDDPEQALA